MNNLSLSKSEEESDQSETDVDKNVTKKMLSKDIIKLSFNFVENNMFLCASEYGVYLYNVDPLMLMLKLGEFIEFLQVNFHKKLFDKQNFMNLFVFNDNLTWLAKSPENLHTTHNLNELIVIFCSSDFNLVGGVAIAETYKRCQFIAIVGGGEKPRFAENTGEIVFERFSFYFGTSGF